jgi:hypothetical protein
MNAIPLAPSEPNPAPSGGDIQQARRTSDEYFPPLGRQQDDIARRYREFEGDEAFENMAARPPQRRYRCTQSFQHFPLIRREIVVKFRIHIASNRKFPLAFASYEAGVKMMRPKRVGNSIQSQITDASRHIKV